MMIHISGYFIYPAKVWSHCSRISEGPLHIHNYPCLSNLVVSTLDLYDSS